MKPEITQLSHDLLAEKVQMTIAFKDFNGAVKERIDLAFPLHMALQDTEGKLKEQSILIARKLLRAASEGLVG